MSSSGISLHRADHSQSILQVFERLFHSSSLVDCTIAAEGQYLKAHRVILSACSPYFEMLFNQENEKNPIVVLKDTKFEDLKAVIDFVYRGQIEIPEGRFRNFVDTVESLQIKGLGSGTTETNAGSRENELSLLQRREGRTSPIARKRIRTSSSSTCENVSQQFPSDGENMNNFPTTSGSVFDQFSSNDTHARTSDQFFRVEENELNQCSTSEANISNQFSTVNVSDQFATSNENVSNKLPCTTTNVSVTKCTVSSENDRHLPVPEIVIFSAKCGLTSDKTQVTSNTAHFVCTPPSEQCPMQAQPPALCAPTELSAQCSLDDLSVVKIEPEPMAEVFLPESECSLEPKDEIVVEETSMFESEEESTEESASDCRHEDSANQCTSFSSLIDATNIVPDERFLMQQVTESTTGQGGLMSGACPAQQQQQLQAVAFAAPRDPLLQQTPTVQGLHVTAQPHVQEQPTATTAGAAAASPPPPPPNGCLECQHSPRAPDHDQAQRPAAAAAAAVEKQQHKCQHCGKLFREVGLLRVHQRLHTKERPYRCDACDASFTHRSSLLTHKRTHAGDKRYQCSACRKTFGRIGDLLIHRRLVCLSRGSPGDG